jgi:competence protein ComEA
MTVPSNKPVPPSSPRLILRRADQAVSAALIAIALVVMAGWSIWQGQLRGRLIDIERAEAISIDFKIDVNHADWPELTLMPNIGEQLAKRIVADRQERGLFRDLSELHCVRGIGPKTLEGMKPFLLGLPDLNSSAKTKTGPQQPAKVN